MLQINKMLQKKCHDTKEIKRNKMFQSNRNKKGRGGERERIETQTRIKKRKNEKWLEQFIQEE